MLFTFLYFSQTILRLAICSVSALAKSGLLFGQNSFYPRFESFLDDPKEHFARVLIVL